MKLLFWGSSNLSVPFLELLINKKLEISAVVTSSDKPQGRGLNILPTPVKLLAEKYNINVVAAENMCYETIQKFSPELSIVVSFGKIIPKDIINIHKIGMLNIHFSLLPKYRGAAPIQWTLLNGEKETGITIFWIDEGMDTGDIFVQEKINVDENDDYYSLSEKLVKLGCDLVENVIERITKGDIVRIKQQGVPSYAPAIKKNQAQISWDKTATEIHNLVRAFVYWPRATSKLCLSTGEIINVKILKTKIVKNEKEVRLKKSVYKEVPFGSIVGIKKEGIVVNCADNTLLSILKLQPENKNVLTAEQFICGYKIKLFNRFL
jgi:methionyl-tRNA formyltransferase